MKIRIQRPHPDYPLAWIHVDVTVDVDRQDLSDILSSRRLTQIGRWETDVVDGSTVGFRAPVLIEDDHVKPRKTRKK